MGKKWLTYPYHIWMALFTVIPLALIVFFAFTSPTGEFTLTAMQRVVDPIYLGVFWHSIYLAGLSTILCFLIGYPMAMILAGTKLKYRSMLVLMIVIPMWMNFLLRTYAWMTLLERKGLINIILTSLHLPAVNILYTDYAVVLGMVYNFLPFMILPIYSVLMKMDKNLIEAAEDLGASRWQAFIKITFPLSLPGVYAGILMVFMPAVTTFVISRLLGGGQYTLIGNLIEEQFLAVGDWNFGSALSVFMLVLILLSLGFMSRYEKENEGGMFF
ncbi:ABC transporter permease [Propionispira raffinosivorans]|uniref:ABC transporter permease n=1 Tax=Propionispira raffinosivorans TaxID=86959 RepID=UPI00036B1A5C|nr:ABC transporter permease [Propionispira raffinosivorans]